MADKHFDAIVSMTGFFGTNFLCHRCKKGYGENYTCKEKCNLCQDTDCNSYDTLARYIVCDDCNCYFKNEACFNSHKKVFVCKSSRCKIFYRRHDCFRILNNKKYPKDSHKCDKYHCNTCKKVVDEGHLCYMQNVAKKQDDDEQEGKRKNPKKKSKEPEFRYLFLI